MTWGILEQSADQQMVSHHHHLLGAIAVVTVENCYASSISCMQSQTFVGNSHAAVLHVTLRNQRNKKFAEAAAKAAAAKAAAANAAAALVALLLLMFCRKSVIFDLDVLYWLSMALGQLAAHVAYFVCVHVQL